MLVRLAQLNQRLADLVPHAAHVLDDEGISNIAPLSPLRLCLHLRLHTAVPFSDLDGNRTQNGSPRLWTSPAAACVGGTLQEHEDVVDFV